MAGDCKCKVAQRAKPDADDSTSKCHRCGIILCSSCKKSILRSCRRCREKYFPFVENELDALANKLSEVGWLINDVILDKLEIVELLHRSRITVYGAPEEDIAYAIHLVSKESSPYSPIFSFVDRKTMLLQGDIRRRSSRSQFAASERLSKSRPSFDSKNENGATLPAGDDP